MSNLDLCYLQASEAIDLFKSCKLSPVELLQALIKRAEQVEPLINAFADTYFEEAIEKAKMAEQKYVNRSSDLRSLEGIPVAIKDEVGIAGKRTTEGSLILKDHISEKNGYIVDRLENAGAIFHARTT